MDSDVGYRLRWKQKGRAREEWYDVVCGPDATFEDVDGALLRFSTIHPMEHVRLYGLEREFENSSLNIVPSEQYEVAGTREQQPADEVKVGEIAAEHGLAEGDRLTMAYDLVAPKHYYCIVKAVVPAEEIGVGGVSVVDEKVPEGSEKRPGTGDKSDEGLRRGIETIDFHSFDSTGP